MEPEDLPEAPTIPAIELKGGAATWRKYAGQVIAVADGEVRAAGETWASALVAAQRAGLSLEGLEFLFVPDGAFVG